MIRGTPLERKIFDTPETHFLAGKTPEEGLSSDEIERLEKVLDKMTQDEVAVVDALLAHKEQELLEV